MTDEDRRLTDDDPVVDSDGVKLSVEAMGAREVDGRKCFCAAVFIFKKVINIVSSLFDNGQTRHKCMLV